MADQTRLEFLKEKLDEQGLVPEQWDDWLEQASETCFAAWKVLEKFEPYAHSTITQLKESEEYLLSLKDELEGGKL